MKIQTRYSKASEWKEAGNDFIGYYFNTLSINEIKERFQNKKVIKVMNMYFRIKAA